MIEVDLQRVIGRLVQRIGELELEIAKYAVAVGQLEAVAVERQQQLVVPRLKIWRLTVLKLLIFQPARLLPARSTLM